MTFRTFALAATLTAFAAMPALAADFSLSSPDLKDGGRLAEAQVSNTFGCDGGNVSPALSWQNAPAGTRSFVVTAYDPDAPTGSGFWHWVMFNIPAYVEGIDAGITPDSGAPKGAVQSRADAGFASYLGACPPAGQTHRYVFSVTALSVEKLELDETASGALIGFITNANALARASITVTYGR
ncbi:MAG: YbhB/YbcL family Raf kinase inhibitor-like protein [Rhizobium sp.]|nr:MAG: YbhB/YbcL family Raf kinase inhibitor-like protein [Rhizobium sp.]